MADLDASIWPDVGTADLAWASASLHHLAQPERTLLRVRQLMNVGGLLVVVELDRMPRFLTASADGSGDLEQRCYDAVQPAMSAHMPHRGADWSTTLLRCGFAIEDSRTISFAVPGSDTPAVAAYAAAALSGIRAAAAPHLTPDDLATLDRLLDPATETSVWNRSDLLATATRSVWIARRTGGPDERFSVAAEAANREHVVGGRRHGMDLAPKG